MLAMLGMFDHWRELSLPGVAIAAAVTVGFTVLAALTLLPALLATPRPLRAAPARATGAEAGKLQLKRRVATWGAGRR